MNWEKISDERLDLLIEWLAEIYSQTYFNEAQSLIKLNLADARAEKRKRSHLRTPI